MKREEMNALLADTENDWAEIKRECDSWDEPIKTLFRLARLGASVAEPTAEEIEAMAKALYELEHGSDNTPFAEVCLSECQREYWTDQARAALLALKDRANG